MTPAERIQAWRRRMKLSQSEAARVLLVSTGTLQHWEQNIREPPKPMLLLMRYIEKFGTL